MAVGQRAIFNPRRHRLLRKLVPVAENFSSLLILGLLALLLVWVIGQRDRFDAATRDLAPELLAGERPRIEIYTPPLKPWVEPGGRAAAAAPDLGMFPPAIVDAQWSLVGRVRKFGSDNLYEKINGEAEKFLKQGFRAMHYAVLRSARDDAELAIELYDQGDVGGSTGIFAAHGAAARDVQERAGVAFFETSVGVIGRKGRFFFRATGDRSSAALRSKATQLVDALTALEGATSEAAPGLRLLTTGMGIAEANVALQSRNAFQFDFAHDFWFARLEEEGEAQLFVHVAESEDAASKLLAALLEEQSYDYEAVESDAPWTTMRHTVLGSYFAIGRRAGVVFGVHRAKDPSRIEPLMQRFARSIEGG